MKSEVALLLPPSLPPSLPCSSLFLLTLPISTLLTSTFSDCFPPCLALLPCQETSPDGVLARINHLLTVVIPSLGLNPLTDAQVLSPTNTGGLGTNALNLVSVGGHLLNAE